MSSLSDEAFDEVRDSVLSTTGVFVLPEQKPQVAERLLRLATELSMDSLGDLIAALRGSDKKIRDRVTESVIATDTSFFRDLSAYRYLRSTVGPRIASARREKKLRVWCGACSTGQEAYSISIMLDHAMPQFKGWDIKIFATDISTNSILKARKGLFAEHEIEAGITERILKKHFEQEDDHWRIARRHSDRIQFEVHNLLEDWGEIGPFDIIFLRNVLCYFEDRHRKRLVDKLGRVMLPDTYLFLGAKERIRQRRYVLRSDPHDACYQLRTQEELAQIDEEKHTTKRQYEPRDRYGLHEILSSSHLFGDLPPAILASIANRFELHEFDHGETLIKQGTRNEAFFVLYEGEVVVSLDRGLFRKNLELARLNRGDVFGEMSLLLNKPTTASVVTEGPVKVFAASRSLFTALCDKHEGFAEYVSGLYRNRWQDTENAIKVNETKPVAAAKVTKPLPRAVPEELRHLVMCDTLRARLVERGGQEAPMTMELMDKFQSMLTTIPFFREMEIEHLDDFVRLVEFWEFPSEARILRIDDNGLGLYILERGQARVLKSSTFWPTGRTVAKLREGQVFGERALINFMPATIEVVSEGRVGLFIVGLDLYRHVVGFNQDVNTALEKLSGRKK
ncbi:MAG: CheR family methyltransferase [Myxococcota bacterium]|nr:CheR family methyltransferase [Myxococcota bacterium]